MNIVGMLREREREREREGSFFLTQSKVHETSFINETSFLDV
jgi:hypothetical protein